MALTTIKSKMRWASGGGGPARGLATLVCPSSYLSTVLLDQQIDQFDVLLLGIFLGSTLQQLPGVPLVAVFQIEHTWLWLVVVTNSGLLVQSVQLQQLVVVWSRWQFVNRFGLRIQ